MDVQTLTLSRPRLELLVCLPFVLRVMGAVAVAWSARKYLV